MFLLRVVGKKFVEDEGYRENLIENAKNIEKVSMEGLQNKILQEAKNEKIIGVLVDKTKEKLTKVKLSPKLLLLTNLMKIIIRKGGH